MSVCVCIFEAGIVKHPQYLYIHPHTFIQSFST